MLDLSTEDFWGINSRNNYTLKGNGFLYLLSDADREMFFILMKSYDNYKSLRMVSSDAFCPERKYTTPPCSFRIERTPFLDELKKIKKKLIDLGLKGSFFPRIEELTNELIKKLEQSKVDYIIFVSLNHCS